MEQRFLRPHARPPPATRRPESLLTGPERSARLFTPPSHRSCSGDIARSDCAAMRAISGVTPAPMPPPCRSASCSQRAGGRMPLGLLWEWHTLCMRCRTSSALQPQSDSASARPHARMLPAKPLPLSSALLAAAPVSARRSCAASAPPPSAASRGWPAQGWGRGAAEGGRGRWVLCSPASCSLPCVCPSARG